MKILLVSEYFPPNIFGGGELSAEILAKNLSKKGHDISILTTYFRRQKKFEMKNNIKIYRKLSSGKSPKKAYDNILRRTLLPITTIIETKKLDKIENFDIIHVLNTTCMEGVALAKTDKKLFSTINNYDALCPKANLFYKEKKICNGCNFKKYISCMKESKFIGKQPLKPYLKYNPFFLVYLYLHYKIRNWSLKKFHTFSISDFIFNFTKDKVKKSTKTYNLMEINDKIIIHKKIKEKIKGKKVITSIGNLEKIKGVDLLIHSFAKIKNKKDTILLIIGDGTDKQNLIDLCNKLNISDNVFFTGKINYIYIPYIYNISNIITIFSRYPEPFSRIMLEATYFGKSIIGTNVGGNSEGIIDGKNGYLVDFNVNKIAHKLKKLINDNKLRQNFSKESKKIFNEKFDVNKITDTIIGAYKKEY